MAKSMRRKSLKKLRKSRRNMKGGMWPFSSSSEKVVPAPTATAHAEVVDKTVSNPMNDAVNENAEPNNNPISNISEPNPTPSSEKTGTDSNTVKNPWWKIWGGKRHSRTKRRKHRK